MPKAKKLPSGSWRCRVQVNGTAKSFTVADPSPAGRRRCERMASEWAETLRTRSAYGGTIRDAIRAYIDLKELTSAPSTLGAYESMLAADFEEIADIPVAEITPQALQEWADRFSAGHSPKTVRNAASLLHAAIRHASGVSYSIKLPESSSKRYGVPTDEDIKKLIAWAEKNDPKLVKAILLGAFGTLRRGEASALLVSDVKDGQVFVTKAYSYGGSSRGFVLKAPKTSESVRAVRLPREVIDRLLRDCGASGDELIGYNPTQITKRFKRAARESGCPPIRFHDLRSYAASIRHALGIPDQFIMADGGWKTPSVMIRVYRRAMEDKREEFAEVSGAHFSELIATEIATK